MRHFFVEPTPAEKHTNPIDVSQSGFQTMLDELTDAQHNGQTLGVRSDSSGARSHA